MQFNYDRQVSKQDPYDMDIDGFTGEFAVAKFLNIMPDFTINERKNAVDLICQGKTIDVKTTRNPNGHIYVTSYHKNSPCDLYVQVILAGNIAQLSGWIDSKTLFEKATYIPGDHASYCLKQSDLFNIESFKRG